MDLDSKTELQTRVKDMLIDDAYLSNVFVDMNSSFTHMEALVLIYHQPFFATNSLGRQPTTTHFF